jgi:hemerythrin superfamily protein
MGTMTRSGTDVVSFLKEQHQEVKQLFDAVLSSHGEERKRAFSKLRMMLEVHEKAEEEIVHPVAKRALADGEAIIDARVREEEDAKAILVKLERMDVSSAQFIEQLERFRGAVLKHAEAEETQEFSALARRLDQSQLANMTKQVERAEATAPSTSVAEPQTTSTR